MCYLYYVKHKQRGFAMGLKTAFMFLFMTFMAMGEVQGMKSAAAQGDDNQNNNIIKNMEVGDNQKSEEEKKIDDDEFKKLSQEKVVSFLEAGSKSPNEGSNSTNEVRNIRK